MDEYKDAFRALARSEPGGVTPTPTPPPPAEA